MDPATRQGASSVMIDKEVVVTLLEGWMDALQELTLDIFACWTMMSGC